ncbi:MAG: hypothetical protein WCX31_10080 [Salinivirgaceae bacterium]
MRTEHILKTDLLTKKEAIHNSDSLKEEYYSEDRIYLEMANRLKKSKKVDESVKFPFLQGNDEKLYTHFF